MLKRAVVAFLTPLVLFFQLNAPIKAAGDIQISQKSTAQTGPFQDLQPLETGKNSFESKIGSTILKGNVTETVKPSPLLYGQIQTIPKNTKLHLSVTANLNSQLSRVGDEILARVSMDVGNGEKVLLPGGWFMHGTVTQSASQKRLGRDGYVTVEFDKLLSPDGDIDLPFKSTFSTKDNQLKAISKTVLVDSGYVTWGALGGSILSVQMTGIPVAVSTHGISVGIGAAVGGGLGLIGALKRKGKIASFFPGDEITITTAEPIEVPGFDTRFIPSANKTPQSVELKVQVDKYAFNKDPFGDKHAKELAVTLTIQNDTKKDFSLFDMAVLSDYGERYYPSLTMEGLKTLKTRIKPHARITTTIAFNVGNAKHKYKLILLNKVNQEAIASCQIN